MKRYFFQEGPPLIDFGQKIAHALKPGARVYLTGDLGMGKTTLVRYILEALGVSERIKSPTYTLVESYRVKDLMLHHFDLYRLTDPEELYFLGVESYFSQESICLIEWPEKGAGILAPPTLEILITQDFKGRYYQLSGNVLI